MASIRLAITVAVIHAITVVYGICCHFPTRNEVAHLPAGIDVLVHCKYDLYNVNPPLPRALAAVPALLMGPNISSLSLDRDGYERPEFYVARHFADDNAGGYLRLFRAARLVTLIWSLIGAYVIWCWCNRLYGATGAFVGLFTWCIDPNINAHAQLVTPDLPATVSAIGLSYSLYLYCNSHSFKIVCATGVVLGIALLCKFTLIVFCPLVLLVVYRKGVYARGYDPNPWRTRFLDSLVIFTTAFTVVNMAYRFDGCFLRLDEYKFKSRLLTTSPGGDNIFLGSLLGSLPVPLPREYLLGIDTQRIDFESGRIKSYLNGQFSEGGWWYFYVYSFLIKTPAGQLLLLGLSLALLMRPRRAANTIKHAGLFIIWAVPLLVLLFVSSQTGMTLHFRYILPCIPFCHILIASTGLYLHRLGRHTRVVLFALFGLSLFEFICVYPHTLSFANIAAGGPARAWTCLADSNVDWGQDALFLKQWIQAHPEASPLRVDYFNFVSYNIIGFEDREIFRTAVHALSDADYVYFAVDVDSLLRDSRELQRIQPYDRVGYSIFIFRVAVRDMRSMTPAFINR